MSGDAPGPGDYARVLAGHARARARSVRTAGRRLDFPAITHRGVTIRPLERGDAAAWTDGLRANEPRMAPWWDTVADWQVASGPRAFADHHLFWTGRRRRGTGLSLAVVEHDRLVGELQLWHIEPPLRSFEIGVWMRPEVSPRAALGAIADAIAHAFSKRGTERIEAPVAVGNAHPRRLYELLGFQREGLLRRARLLHGVPTDHELFALLPEDFAAAEPTLRRLTGG